MAKVLKVVISVVAPEKSIVPWAWATPANESARRVGAIVRMAERSVVLRVVSRQPVGGRNEQPIATGVAIGRYGGIDSLCTSADSGVSIRAKLGRFRGRVQ